MNNILNKDSVTLNKLFVNQKMKINEKFVNVDTKVFLKFLWHVNKSSILGVDKLDIFILLIR